MGVRRRFSTCTGEPWVYSGNSRIARESRGCTAEILDLHAGVVQFTRDLPVVVSDVEVDKQAEDRPFLCSGILIQPGLLGMVNNCVRNSS